MGRILGEAIPGSNAETCAPTAVWPPVKVPWAKQGSSHVVQCSITRIRAPLIGRKLTAELLRRIQAPIYVVHPGLLRCGAYDYRLSLYPDMKGDRCLDRDEVPGDVLLELDSVMSKMNSRQGFIRDQTCDEGWRRERGDDELDISKFRHKVTGRVIFYFLCLSKLRQTCVA